MNDDGQRAGSRRQRRSDEPVSLLMRAILNHLDAHPHAADSAEGVAQWWLGSPRAAAALADVEDALARLVAARRLRRVHLADGTTLYSKNLSDD